MILTDVSNTSASTWVGGWGTSTGVGHVRQGPLTTHPGDDLAAGEHWAALRPDGAAGLHGHCQGEQVSPGLGRSHCTANIKLKFTCFQYTILLVLVFMFESVIGLLAYVYQVFAIHHVEVTALAGFGIAKPIIEITSSWSRLPLP